jgi:hypothetical protein
MPGTPPQQDPSHRSILLHGVIVGLDCIGVVEMGHYPEPRRSTMALSQGSVVTHELASRPERDWRISKRPQHLYETRF